MLQTHGKGNKMQPKKQKMQRNTRTTSAKKKNTKIGKGGFVRYGFLRDVKGTSRKACSFCKTALSFPLEIPKGSNCAWTDGGGVQMYHKWGGSNDFFGEGFMDVFLQGHFFTPPTPPA